MTTDKDTGDAPATKRGLRWFLFDRDAMKPVRSAAFRFARRGWRRPVFLGCPLAASIVVMLWGLERMAFFATLPLDDLPKLYSDPSASWVGLAEFWMMAVVGLIMLWFAYLVFLCIPLALVAGAVATATVAVATRTWFCERTHRSWAGLAVGAALSSFGAYLLGCFDTIADDWLDYVLVLFTVIPIAVGQAVGVAIVGRPPLPRRAHRRQRRPLWPSIPRFTLRSLVAVVTGLAVSLGALRLVWLSSPSLAVHFATLLALSVTWLPLCVYAERAVAVRGWFRRTRGAG